MVLIFFVDEQCAIVSIQNLITRLWNWKTFGFWNVLPTMNKVSANISEQVSVK